MASSSRPNRSSRLHSSVNARKHGFERAAVVGAEIGDGLEIRLQCPQQPDHLDVAVTLGLKSAARTYSVQIAINVKLQQIAWSVARPPRGLCLHPREARLRQIEAVNEGVDEADGI